MVLFAAFVLSTFLTMVMIPPLIKWSGVLQLVDVPNERKVHVNAIPRIGGIAMFLGCLVSIALWLDTDDHFFWLVVSFSLIVLFGVMDDRMELKYGSKFIGQLLAAVIAVILGDVQIKYLPFMGLQEISTFLSIPITIFCLLAITNAMNLVDGLDGLAGGTMLLVFGVVFVLGYQTGSLEVTLLSVAIMGSILGFLRFNTHPAMVFMGDCGSQFLGFAAGVLVVVLYQSQGSTLSPALPFLLLGFPVLDTSLVMIRRIKEGRSPFSPDKNHIHHRLIAGGLSHFEAVFCLYVIQSVLAILSYLLRYESDIVVIGSFLIVSSIIILLVRKVHVFNGSSTGGESHLTDVKQKLYTYRYSLGVKIIAITLPLYVAGLMFVDVNLNADITFFSVFLMIAYLVAAFYNNKNEFGWIEKGVIYVTYSLLVYVMHQADLGALDQFYNVYLALLAILIVFGYHYSKSARFQITTLDFLVVFSALSIQYFDFMEYLFHEWTHEIIKIVVLFYAAEMLMSGIYDQFKKLRISFVMQLILLNIVIISPY